MDRSRVWVLLLLLLLGPGPARAGGVLTIVTVGPGATCDFNSLQLAINSASTGAADLTEIRLTADILDQSVSITDRNITIRGDFVGCNGNPPARIRRSIAGDLMNSVIRATTTGDTPRTLTLRELIVRDGGADSAAELGGGVFVQGRVGLVLDAVSVSRNVSVRGGGIAVVGPFASVLLDGDSIIGSDAGAMLNGNGTQSLFPLMGIGGGIYCSGGTVVVRRASIRSNTSSVHGAGIFASDCTVEIVQAAGNAGSVRAVITGNVAFGGDGGGIYATGGSVVSWRGTQAGAIAGAALNNRANTGSGGAVFLTGASDFIGEYVRFVDNRAEVRGGAIAVEDTSNLILRGGDGMNCASVGNCPGIFGTRGITEGESATLIGGAIHASAGAQVLLTQQHLYDNFANNGSALHLNGSATRAVLSGVLVARNVLYGVGNGTSTIELTSSADAVLRHVTMATNFRVSAGFPGIERAVSSLRANGAQGTVEMRNSSFFDDAVSVVRLLVGATVEAGCVLAHESASVPGASVIDPQYVNTVGDFPDFGLGPSSPGLDRCLTSGANEADVEGRPRPIDIIGISNGPGAFDVGAFERFTDDMLRDGFESPPP